MGYDSLFARQELFVAAACVGAHANSKEGFRQRDVKFLVDLFINWTESTLHRGEICIRNTQVLRYLDGLVAEGYARRLVKRRHPLYRLTRTGLLEILSRMALQPQIGRGARFFFVHYFLKNYRDRLINLIEAEGRLFPKALKVELEQILDIDALVNRELQQTDKELQKLEERIRDAKSTSALTEDLLLKNVPFAKIVEIAEREYPYELNSQKPLSELIDSIPEPSRSWELQHGNVRRVADLWSPEKAMLVCYREQLTKLRSDAS